MSLSVRRRTALTAACIVAAGAAGLVALSTSGGSEPRVIDARDATDTERRGGQRETSDAVGVFPAPGTRTASPQTEISFRGTSADSVEEVGVTGSVSGERRGDVREHADGEGASLVFDEPFVAGESVLVSSDLEIAGARDGDLRFGTVPRPRTGLGSGSPQPPGLLREYFSEADLGEDVPNGYRSRPDLRAPEIDVHDRAGPRVADGEIFIAPKTVFGARERRGLHRGPLIVDDDGEPLWFAELGDVNGNDFRVQEYEGEPVLTWWQGRSLKGAGEGEVVLVDGSYEQVARVRGGNGYQLDFHEARLTERGTLLGLAYNTVNADLSSVGGPRDGRAIDAIVQEVEVATGRVLLEWHSLDDIAVAESYAEVPEDEPFDYFHVNSIAIDDDGNLLVSARNTWGTYKLDRRTGDVMWRLGGKRSDYRMSDDAVFAWQHDSQRDPDGTIRIFDNQASPEVREHSRVLWLALDDARMTARIARSVEHPEGLLAGTQGNAQALPGGNTFVGWGSQGYFSEYSARGELLFDASVANGNDAYRAYRMPWEGRPDDAPAVASRARGRGRGRGTAVYASWNGATEVAAWEVLAGERPDALRPVGSARRDGFETRIDVRAGARLIAVRARDARGRTLGVSEPVEP